MPDFSRAARTCLVDRRACLFHVCSHDSAGGQCRFAASWRASAGVAGPAHGAARRGDRRGGGAGIRARRVPAAAGAPVLVPGVRLRDGDGLAFLRHHHQRHRRPEARAEAAGEGARPPRLRRARQAFAQDAGGAGRHRRAGGLRRRGAGAGQPAGRQGGQRGRAGRLPALSARLHRRRRRALGGRPTGDEGRRAICAPLSLDLGGAGELPRYAACGHRRARTGQHSQPRGPAGGGFAAGAGDAAGIDRAGRRGARDGGAGTACGSGRSGTGSGAPSPASHHAGASRGARRGRYPAAAAREPGGGGRPGARGFHRAAAGAGGRRAHGAGAGDGGRGDPRDALPVHRPCPLLARPRRQGRASISGAAEGIRRDDPGAEIGGADRAARARGGERRDPPAGYAGAAAGAARHGADGQRIHRGGTGAVAHLWRPNRFRLG